MAYSSNIIKVLSTSMSVDRWKRMQDIVNKRVNNVQLILENISTEHNASAVLRTAEGLGIHNLHIIETYNSYIFSEDIHTGAGTII